MFHLLPPFCDSTAIFQFSMGTHFISGCINKFSSFFIATFHTYSGSVIFDLTSAFSILHMPHQLALSPLRMGTRGICTFFPFRQRIYFPVLALKKIIIRNFFCKYLFLFIIHYKYKIFAEIIFFVGLILLWRRVRKDCQAACQAHGCHYDT